MLHKSFVAQIGVWFCALVLFNSQPLLAQETLSIAVIGPMSGENAHSGKAMVAGVQQQIDSINARGGIQGRRLELKIYDDRQNPRAAREQARKIARQSDSVAVVGHYHSSMSLYGGAIYQEYGIPAITGSATAPAVTRDNDWYFRVISDNSRQGELAALYLSGVLGYSPVSILYEEDAYGQTLMRSFSAAADTLDLEIQDVWAINSNHGQVAEKLAMIVRRLQREPRPAALYLGLLGREAATFVRRLCQVGLDIPVLGGDALGRGSFPAKIAALIGDQEQVGDFTHGIYATTYFIRDIANKKAQEFSLDFIDQYSREPDALNATSYDAAGLVLEALAEINLDQGLKQVRRELRAVLQSYVDPRKAYLGVTGRIYFDSQGNAINPSPFGRYVRDTLVSAPEQLTPVHLRDRIIDLETRIDEGSVLRFQERLYNKTEVVYTGLDMNKLLHIDQKNGTFTADFYLWFRHENPLDFSAIEFLNCDVQLDADRDPIMVGKIDGMRYRAYRIKADFKESFQFQDYPFDSQTLRIRLRHKQLNRDQLIFVADDIGMQRQRGHSLLQRLRAHAGFKGERKWKLEDILVYSDIGTADSTLGNPRLFFGGTETGISYSRFNFAARITRNATSYMVKNMVPLFFIFLLGYAMTFIYPEGPPFAARLNLGVILLLTTVSLSLMTANQLPSIGYLVAMDYIYFFVYFWLLIGILVAIGSRSAYLHGYPGLRARLEWSVRILQPLLLALMITVLVWIYG